MQVTGYKARNIKGNWHAIVYWKDDDGKRHQNSSRLHVDTEKEAEREALERYIACKTGEVKLFTRKNASENMFSYAESYFKGRLDRHEYERSTYATNLKHLRAWKRAIGDKNLSKVTENDVKTAISTWFEQGRDATTVDKRITCLNEVFKAAMYENLCEKNPFERIKRPKKGWKQLNGCNSSDVRADIAETLLNLPLDSLKVAFNLAFWTGMRRGEVCGLRWSDIDLDSRSMWVRTSIGTDDCGKYVKAPKSDKPRDLIMPDQLRDVLEAWKSECEARFGRCFSDSMRIVCDDEGNYLNPDYITHSFTHLARFKGWEGAAGRRLTLHDLRHTVATVLITEGADVKAVQSVLGHSSAKITLDMYASADSRAKWDAAGILEHSIRKSAPKDARSWAGTRTERRHAQIRHALAV